MHRSRELERVNSIKNTQNHSMLFQGPVFFCPKALSRRLSLHGWHFITHEHIQFIYHLFPEMCSVVNSLCISLILIDELECIMEIPGKIFSVDSPKIKIRTWLCVWGHCLYSCFQPWETYEYPTDSSWMSIKNHNRQQCRIQKPRAASNWFACVTLSNIVLILRSVVPLLANKTMLNILMIQ